uniref:WAP domain-containing protein n=1 Tax=Salarias fasciatus TaxID=181472 RepID=A0A672F8U6_SALFA
VCMCGRLTNVVMSVNVLLSVLSVKPGVCPPFPFSRLFLCPHVLPECDKDYECTGKQKCCSNQCGRLCVDPLPIKDEVKPGVCPHFPFPRHFVCPPHVRPECESDRDCKGKKKCCKNHCGPVCADPLPIKDEGEMEQSSLA